MNSTQTAHETIESIIGLEVHVQLATRTKMFCGCALEFGAEPNTRVCPVCLGLPGALPVINRKAVECAVRTALALNCRIASFTKWDRKSYYYPDLPKNYQISQFDQPLATGGYMEFPFDGKFGKVRIRRAHLEEDAGKNIHEIPGCTAVDLNRAGAPLLEIVTEPDLRTPEDTTEFAVQLQRLVSYLGVSDANMQMGQMRFEPNVNLKITRNGDEFRTPIVEVKNLNSFRSLYAAVEYEISRQARAWQSGELRPGSEGKSNRGWDDQRLVTVPQREKEEAHDYRYFPDPDLVPLTLDPHWIESMRESMPELPICRTVRFIAEYKLPPKDAPAIVSHRATADLLDAASAAGGDPVTLGKHFLSFWSMHANQRGTHIAGLNVAPDAMAEISRLVSDGKINATAAAQLADSTLEDSSARPTELAQRLGLLQSRDENQIAAWIDAAFANNEQAVRDARENPKKIQAARGFLTGQVMKISGGKADPKIVGALIEKKFSDESR